ncbi:Phospholipid methyltransferase [Candidatus Norongarragalina meridionalis]|nr:Phospholipid methyltransferase [Candidatus Norongarragalina meridionalis]
MKKKTRLGLWMLIPGTSIIILVLVAILACAGRTDYWQGWLFFFLTIAGYVGNYLAIRDKPDLVSERLKPGKGVKWWDMLYFALSTPLFLIMIGVSALDAGRFGWTTVPTWLVLFGSLVYLAGYAVFLWAKHVNSYFSSFVRIQKDRGQTVCTEGPYKIVRHPGYVGAILYTVASPLVLGSFWGLVPALLTLFVLIGRTYMEDNMLKNELPGYAKYAQRVRYRLAPGIW